MKSGLLLMVSLSLNLILAAAWFALRGNVPAPPAIPPAVVTTTAETAAAAATNAVTPGVPAAPASPFPWRMIESDDYRRYMANLRAVGCPEPLIRDIIVADMDELYSRTTRLPPSSLQPWQSAARRKIAREFATRARGQQIEKRAVVRELLGYDWDSRVNDVWSHDSVVALLRGFLSPIKSMQVEEICEKYNALAGDVREHANSILIAEDRDRLKALYSARDAEIAQLLGPVESEELELRLRALEFSGTVLSLSGVTVSGAEYREIARASRVLKEAVWFELPDDENPAGPELARRKAVFEEKLKGLLGPQRFADYLRAQDDQFRAAYDFAQSRNLPAPAAAGIYEARRKAEAEAGMVRMDASLSAEEKSAVLAALKATTLQAIASRLGDAYQDYLGGPGQWVDELTLLPGTNTPEAIP